MAWRIASLCFAAAPVLGCVHLLMVSQSNEEIPHDMYLKVLLLKVAESPSFFLSKGKHIAAGKTIQFLLAIIKMVRLFF